MIWLLLLVFSCIVFLIGVGMVISRDVAFFVCKKLYLKKTPTMCNDYAKNKTSRLLDFINIVIPSFILLLVFLFKFLEFLNIL